MSTLTIDADPVPDRDAAWCDRFRAGDRRALEDVYRTCFDVVDGAVGRVLQGADRETAVHEVFARLLSDESLRNNFQGGSLRAWLSVVSRNHAIDVLRRRAREDLVPPEQTPSTADSFEDRLQARVEAKALIERFRREQLPEKWRGVFETRFLRQLSQREAAAELGITRTTLAYQELRVRSRLKEFLLRHGDVS